MGEFLNRRPHLEKLSELFRTGAAQGAVVAVYGAPGVGKSALIKEAAKAAASHYCYVYCDRQTEGVLSGQPLPELLQRRLSALSVENGFMSFDVFRNDKRWIKTFVRGGEAVGLVVAKTVLPSDSADFVVESYQQARSAWEKRGRNVPKSFDLDDQRLLYALTVFEKNPAIIHIDHAQYIEPHELEILLHLVDATKAVLFLEYATNEPFSKVTLAPQLIDRPVLGFKIEKLAEQYTDRLFASLPERFASVLREQFEQTGGDLRLFDQAVAIQSRRNNIVEIFDITDDSLTRTIELSMARLDNEKKHLVVALSSHAGPIERDLLQEFIDSLPAIAGFSKSLDVNEAIDQLDGSLLVVATANDVMSHVRAIKEVDRDPQLAKIKLMFRKYWKIFYQDLPNRQVFVSDEARCRQLLHQCAELEDFVGIARTLQEVGKRGISRRNPRAIVVYLQEIISKLKFSNDRLAMSRVTLSQCLFFYQTGWFDDALTCLLMVDELPRTYEYMLSELYASTDQQSKAIRLAQNHIDQLDPDEAHALDSELCLRLIIMHALRNSDRLQEARAYYLEAISRKKYASLKAFPTLLRYADFCLYKDEDQPLCIQYLRQAERLIKESQSHGNGHKQAFQVEYVSICLSLVQQLGYTEALEEVEGYLQEVDEIAQDSWIQQATLMANWAVLAMYRGIFSIEDRDRLRQALLLSYDPLDRILIQINLLVWYAMAGQFDEVRRIANSLHNVTSNPMIDTEIRRIGLYNLEQLERVLGNDAKADELYTRWSAMESGIDVAYWCFRRSRNVLPPSSSPRYQMQFHPVYLAHWHTGTVPFEAIGNEL
ncbi:ATP-binding protein [Herbaspirillum sp. alder98]|uniref:ATP-binding protein n=1 Tax=Herbaspirillum sp. alder98 TaxID=2913096 RepID=UPI001CD89F66|nr:ATP-binding protein [Herbaspirillum sp. alder98]MCA1325094.1 ATP-binding protein [Herbaspirillum sp. alder98]